MERPEGETGLGKTQVGLIRKQLQTNHMEMKQVGVARKKICKSNWKQNHVLRLIEKGDEYLGRSKKTDKLPLWSLGRLCLRKIGGYQCMGIGDDDREIFKYVWSNSWEQKKKIFLTSLIEKDDVAPRMV